MKWLHTDTCTYVILVKYMCHLNCHCVRWEENSIVNKETVNMHAWSNYILWLHTHTIHVYTCVNRSLLYIGRQLWDHCYSELSIYYNLYNVTMPVQYIYILYIISIIDTYSIQCDKYIVFIYLCLYYVCVYTTMYAHAPTYINHQQCN